MGNFKISTRLVMAFTAMLVLLMALGGMCLSLSAKQRSELEEVVQTRVPITKALGVVVDGLNTQSIQYRNLLIFSSDKDVELALSQIATARSSTAEQFKLLDEAVSTAEGKEFVDRLRKARSEFITAGDELLTVSNRKPRASHRSARQARSPDPTGLLDHGERTDAGPGRPYR